MQVNKYKYFSYLVGGTIYMTGDMIASFINGEPDLWRSIGVFIVGSTIYAYEIKSYFIWIDKKVHVLSATNRKWVKTFLALLYFNPLWIARHLCIVYLVSGKGDQISSSLMHSALISFLINIPVSIIANYIIQNKTPLEYRFWAIALFSGLMAVYYSMSSVWF
ncbi:MAG TPA: hypothetical protein PK611_03245 [Saprospiraceae bacterium]|nr:hypothetical protein [Saprospiraceae bacterium]